MVPNEIGINARARPVFSGDLAKQSIWQNKIATLSESEAMNLAQEFDFSGGAIENIARKVLMAGVLNGRQPGVDEIVAFCREESLYKTKETRRIGYLQ